MTQRIKHALLPVLATMMVIAGMTAGVTASANIQFPTWGGSGGDFVAGPLGLNPAASAGSAPVSIQVPDASVDAEVELNQIVDGVMLDPSGPYVVSWYEETGMLGELDNVVMSGHVDYWEVGPAVFYTVAQLGENAQIQVAGDDGSTYTYAVEWVQDYDVAELTPEAIRDIVGPTDYRALTLITCGGEFDTNSGEYLSRTIVRARLIDANVPAESADAAGAVSAPDTSALEGITGSPEDTEIVEALPVEAAASEATAQLAVGSIASVTDNGLNMRASASTSADIVTTLAQGQQATIIGGPQDADGFAWWQIELEDGTQGWVAADFLQP
ncbi:MAG: sortase [Chloroflexota bacterium]|nr:sortase [Chloroflexota bacterium]